MTLYRATLLDVPDDPFGGGTLRAELDGGIVVDAGGLIIASGPYPEVRRDFPDESLETLEGILLPGFVDTHVHYPQIRAIGGLGMPLLDWLDRCALPEESRLADRAYAAAVATEFLAGLRSAGTTSALVFGAHFPGAMDEFCAAAGASGLRITTGLVLADRGLRPDLLTTPAAAVEQSAALAARWHGRGRLRYAVTPRFALSSTDELLAACGQLLGDLDGATFTTHVNENPHEIAGVRAQFPHAASYVDAYARHGLVTGASVFAHDVHVTPDELRCLGDGRAAVAHCPTSNAALGSGLFPLAAHVAAGVRVALGSDVGAGTGLFVPKEALQAYFMQQLLGADGYPLTPVHLLWLATRAGALALGLDVGDLTPGRPFDAVLLTPPAGSPLAVNLAAAADPSDSLARIFALATPADIAQVWVAGTPLR